VQINRENDPSRSGVKRRRERNNKRRKTEIFILVHVRSYGKISRRQRCEHGAFVHITKGRDTRTSFVASTHGERDGHTRESLCSHVGVSQPDAR
jgi:hypothetical protein